MTSKQFNLKDCGKPEPEPKPSFSAYIKWADNIRLDRVSYYVLEGT
jgi:hypothetical protein